MQSYQQTRPINGGVLWCLIGCERLTDHSFEWMSYVIIIIIIKDLLRELYDHTSEFMKKLVAYALCMYCTVVENPVSRHWSSLQIGIGIVRNSQIYLDGITEIGKYESFFLVFPEPLMRIKNIRLFFQNTFRQNQCSYSPFTKQKSMTKTNTVV